jgi:lysophospholipase L1-like esterase
MRPLCLLLALLALALACAQPAAPPAPAPPPPAPPPPLLHNPRLLLPPEIPAVPGREANLYFENVILCARPDLLLYDVDCPRGQQQVERWTWTPKPEEVGSFPLTLRITDPLGEWAVEATTTIHVYPADAGAGKPVTALIIGDSLTAATVYVAETLALTKAEGNPALTLIGTNVPNAATPEVRHEGYGGWRAVSFATMWGPEPIKDGRRARSPFLFEKDGKPVLDFQMYCDQQNGGKGPDFITLLLGCNDNFGAKDDTIEASIDGFLQYMDILIAEFHRVRPDTKIGIISLMPPAATQDAFGSNYFCGQTRWQYRKNQHRVMERVVEKYTGCEAQNIFLVPAYVNLDCVHNYPATEAPANARADGPGSKVIRLINGVHPAGPGYKQMADSIYCWMKGMLSKP